MLDIDSVQYGDRVGEDDSRQDGSKEEEKPCNVRILELTLCEQQITLFLVEENTYR